MAPPSKNHDIAAPAWMRQLAMALGRYQVPAHEVSCDAGILRVAMGRDRRLVAEVRPAAQGRQGWAEVDGFIIGYQGRGDLGPEREGWMRSLATVVEQLSHVLPPALDDPGAIFSGKVHPEEKFRRAFPFCEVERSRVKGAEVVEVLLRATSRCNQACPFCSASERPTASAEAVQSCLHMAGQVYPGCMLTITGGEPTLRPSFMEEVQAALEHPGVGHVQVQTNAVAFSSRLDPAALPARDDLAFFVSLHALNPELYDACTATRGQLPRALAGAARIMDAGHPVIVNCVAQRLNLDHLLEFVEALPRSLPWNDSATLHFSVLICPEYRPEAADYLVRYSELAPALEAAAVRGEALGLRVDPLRGSTHAAMPACVLGEGHRAGSHRPRVQPGETGHEDFTHPWVKAARCRDCPENPTCLGLPTAYARRFGLDELEPI